VHILTNHLFQFQVGRHLDMKSFKIRKLAHRFLIKIGLSRILRREPSNSVGWLQNLGIWKWRHKNQIKIAYYFKTFQSVGWTLHAYRVVHDIQMGSMWIMRYFLMRCSIRKSNSIGRHQSIPEMYIFHFTYCFPLLYTCPLYWFNEKASICYITLLEIF